MLLRAQRRLFVIPLHLESSKAGFVAGPGIVVDAEDRRVRAAIGVAVRWSSPSDDPLQEPRRGGNRFRWLGRTPAVAAIDVEGKKSEHLDRFSRSIAR